jgi:hypothetical protein
LTRLLFVTHTLDFEAGGAERVLFDVLKRIDRSRFDVSVFVGQDEKGVPPEFSELGFPISVHTNLPLGIHFPERAPLGLLVRRPSIGGAENAACFSYSPNSARRANLPCPSKETRDGHCRRCRTKST